MKRFLYIVVALFSFVSHVAAQSSAVSIQHVRGFYSDLGVGGYQQVHTVERTIYYTGNEAKLPLALAESNMFGYMRWYNYTNDRGIGTTWVDKPNGNGGEFTEITDGTISLGWFGWNGDGGVLANSENSNKTPSIKPWTDGQEHVIACDVSTYTNYTLTKRDGKVVRVIEPTLSYRQIFRFKPASVMADTLMAKSSRGEFLEHYVYTAPIRPNNSIGGNTTYKKNQYLRGAQIYLTTEFRHSVGTDAEKCYFYKDGDAIKRISKTNVEWWEVDKDGNKKSTLNNNNTTYNVKDYWEIYSTSVGTKYYQLRYTKGTNNSSDDILIASYQVNFVDDCGPLQETTKTTGQGSNQTTITKALKSYEDIARDYEILEYNNFSYGQTPDGASSQYLTRSLPAIQSTYGFFDGTTIGVKPNDPIPYFGEYCIVNRVNNNDRTWATGANHKDGTIDDAVAARDGFAMYVDGTTEPGLVASISTNVTICGQRTMYCSVWLRNPRHDSDYNNGTGGYSLPVFRCNVQGRNKSTNGEYTAWEDVGVFFVGALPFESGWNQVIFPINPNDTYSECRIQIYNFGTGGNGNDFWLDDLCIFAEKLPMTSYQLQTETCCSPNYAGVTFTAAVLRVDYGSTTLVDDSYQYYQIYNKTENKPLKLTEESLSPYYHENNDIKNATDESLKSSYGLTKEQFGSVKVRPHTYTPSDNEIYANPGVLVQELLEAYANDKNNPKTAPLWGKCFVMKDPSEVTSTSQGNYYMYVVHIVPNIHGNRVEENYLQEHCEYTLRMTNTPGDLIGETLSCAVEIALPPTQESLFRLKSDQMETTEFLTQSSGNCANELYTLEAFIRRDDDPYSEQGKVEGTYLADWIYGHAFDEVYRLDYPHTTDATENTAKDDADIRFQNTYKCTRQQVTDAFLDLRRPEQTNPNYNVTKFDQIDPEALSDYNKPENQKYASKSAHYETLKYLHEQGWLQLARSSVSFYLGSEATARYWVYPIENSAKASDGKTALHDCPEPRWVQVSSVHSNYQINLSPGYTLENLAGQAVDPRRGTLVPSVRVLARLVNNTIQIPIHEVSSGDYEVHFTGTDGYIYLTNDDDIDNPEAEKYTCSRNGDMIILQPVSKAGAQLDLGKEYTLCIRMRDKNNHYTPDGATCQVGKIYVRVLILPDEIKWNPQNGSSNWHDDNNWQGYGDGMAGYKYTPISGSNVVIPFSESGYYPKLEVLERSAHPYPMDANYALEPTCGIVYFEPGAMIGNQHLLNYEKAYVDMEISAGNWNSVASPLKDVYSGDMYIPHQGQTYKDIDAESLESDNPFEIVPFAGYRSSKAPYSFWISYYNKDVAHFHENYSTPSNKFSTSTTTFTPANTLEEPLVPTMGYQLKGYGLDEEKLVIRLPKSDTEYEYFAANGIDKSGRKTATLERANSGKLAYELTGEGMNITLTNKEPSQYFMFGNPSMAMVDLLAFVNDNVAATFYYMEGDTWKANTVGTMLYTGERYLKPTQSTLIQLEKAAQEVNLVLKPNHLVTTNTPAVSEGMPKKRTTASSTLLQMMTINATAKGKSARSILAVSPYASDEYIHGEDALFISSGVEDGVNSSAATSPVNMYTVSNGVPMMVDVRETIDTVPLSMLLQEKYLKEKITISFNLSDDWEVECYFCDAQTGTRTLIENGLALEIEMPANHEVRYYIEGVHEAPGNDGGLTTSVDQVRPTQVQVWAYGRGHGELVVATNDIIKEVTVYDITGRIIARQALDLYYNTTSLTVPAGVCVVEATMRDNTKQYTQAIVK